MNSLSSRLKPLVAGVVMLVSLPSCLVSQLAPPTSLTSAQVTRIGQRIWQNECEGKIAGLTSWNQGEEFASLGIGHFIWYPKGYEGPFEESFPKLVAFLRERGAVLPAWMARVEDCPWNNREAFLADASSAQQKALRALLSSTVREQTEFIIARLQQAMPKLAAAGGPHVQANAAALSQTAEGMFAMIDYINFKGDGINPTERYEGVGWGLAQVLGEMKSGTAGEFGEAAKHVLARRVKHAPAARHEGQWLAGWSGRCDRYKRPL